MMRVLDSKKLRPLISAVHLTPHDLIQRCTVSGTAKGKGKVKAGQTLKKSKVSTKKGKPTGEADSGEKTGGFRERDVLEKTIESCLSATSPLRHLKPKEMERERERERMGLVSKARTKEMEMLKKNKNQKSEFDSPMMIGTPGFDLISLGLVDADAIPKYELTVEDGRRLAKECSRVLMRKHRARQAAESAFLNLKKEAIEALPENLKAAALVPDLSPFPTNRFMATLTPPIEGYIEKINEAARQTTRKAKLR